MRKVLVLSCLLAALIFGSVCTPANSNSTPNLDTSAVAGQDKGNPSVKVWVNTKSKVYHCPGTRWYGATKAGEYMTQKEALDKGNRPAYGKYCQ
jgi:hypothetical protein